MSITTIANLSGVSVSTVSNFLNHPDKVAPGTARAIRAALEKHPWSPDIRRRGPKNAARVGVKTGNIVLFVMTNFRPREIITMPTSSLIFSSIQYELNQRQFALTLSGLNDDGGIPSVLNPQFCDGVILLGCPDDETAAILNRKLDKLPAIWCMREFSKSVHDMDHIFYDNRMIGPMAADYLFGRGHRRVAILNDSVSHRAYMERTAGFRKQAEELGMTVREISIDTSYRYPTAADFRQMAEAFLASGRQDATGAFFCSDDAMLGVYNELRFRLGAEPELDMIGCNADPNIMRYFLRRPASIDIKLDEIGKMTVEMLLHRINGNSSCFSEIFIKPELIPGE